MGQGAIADVALPVPAPRDLHAAGRACLMPEPEAAITATMAPYTAALSKASSKSAGVANDANVATKLPGAPPCTNTLNR